MKRFFTKGLIAVLPLALTATVLYVVVSFLYNNVGVPIGELLKWGVERIGGEATWAHRQSWFFNQGAPLLGFAAAIVLTFVAGFLVATFFGRKLYAWFEAIVKRVPVIGIIYPYARQFADFFFSEEKKADFQTAVAVPYPMRGLYAIGFVTGEGMKTLNESTGKHLVCVFLPNAPMPFSGFVLYVPREDLIPLPISVDEAMRIIISAGVIHPSHQAAGSGLAGGLPHPGIPEALVRTIAREPETPKN